MKRMTEKINQNTNTVVSNLHSHVLANEEYNILKFGQKYELPHDLMNQMC